ncbi:MAG: diguanylate cyclase response regulator [Sulfurimonas sp.]|nr:MAG: diguanylate cyclase response regulator [Sulfurimonas sp.]
MEKILVVEDNTSLATMLSLKIESALPFEVDIAYSLKEAQLFVRKFDYFIVLLDSHLPDAPNGEAVDAMLSKAMNCIVLSNNVDKVFRQKMLQKPIIDYIGKGGVEEVDFIISTIERLHKNRNHTVMLVDDSMVFRKQMKSMLEHLFFHVIACAHGEEAINLLQERDDISLVITDYNMPVMNGLELTAAIRKQFKKHQLSILAISGNSDDDVSAMFLKKGATDFIKKPFLKEEFSCRVNNTIEALENTAAITNSANRDFVTGLYNRRYFDSYMQQYLEQVQERSEHFVLVMAEPRSPATQQELVQVSEILRSYIEPYDLLVRYSEEEFCMVLKQRTSEQTRTLLERIVDYAKGVDTDIALGFTCHFDNGLQEMLNHVDMMLHNAKHSGDIEGD